MTMPEKVLVNCDHLTCFYKKLLIPKYILVLVRHTESEWNEQKIYSGWYDSVLSRRGKVKAMMAGENLKKSNFKLDMAFTSVLTRATKTLETILREIEQTDIPVKKSWRLNQRHYGALTGLNESDAVNKYGENLINLWRNSFDMTPPDMEEDHMCFDLITKDPRYVLEPYPSEFPLSESVEHSINRTLHYWNKTIYPAIKTGKNVLIVAHDSSIKAILKHLLHKTDENILKIKIPYGIPLYFDLNSEFNILGPYKYLNTSENINYIDATSNLLMF